MSNTGRRTLARVAFTLLTMLMASCGESTVPAPATPAAAPVAEWPMYGGSVERRFFNPAETQITAQSVARLVPRWRFLTGAVVMASPVVAAIDRPGEPGLQTVFASSWDRHFYALRANDGTMIWSYRFKTHPGSAFQQSSSPAVADIDGHRLAYVASGETLYCLDAASGALVWQFDVGTGCTTCDRQTERNEIASSPAIFDGMVYFGMDVNEFRAGKGGLFAVDARSGVLRWFFDLETGATCRPNAEDAVHRFDGFHSAASLGLPEDFFATRSGCNFDRTPNSCGNIWASPTIDATRRMLYITSANCDAATDPAPPYEEAIFALSLEGNPAWVWRPRSIDPEDLDFGVPPNLFEADIGGARRAVVGAGGKDGTYYVLDRSGVNALTGKVEPYWTTNVVPGGSQGGIIAPAAVGEGRVFFGTAIGGDDNDFTNYQKPAAWSLGASDGQVVWSNPQALPSFSPTTAIPGVVFMGSISSKVFAYDTGSGAPLAALVAGGPLSSPAVVVNGQLYIGAGTGAREGAPEDIEYITSLIPSPVTAFCLAGTAGCPESGKCNQGNPCQAAQLAADDTCVYSQLPDGTECQIGALAGACVGGVCHVANLDCDDGNQCTRDTPGASGCNYASEPPTTACTVNGQNGVCRDGYCDLSAPAAVAQE